MDPIRESSGPKHRTLLAKDGLENLDSSSDFNHFGSFSKPTFLHEWPAHLDRVSSVASEPNERYLLTAGRGFIFGSSKPVVRVWSLESTHSVVQYTAHQYDIHQIVVLNSYGLSNRNTNMYNSHMNNEDNDENDCNGDDLSNSPLACSLDVGGHLHVWDIRNGRNRFVMSNSNIHHKRHSNGDDSYGGGVMNGKMNGMMSGASTTIDADQVKSSNTLPNRDKKGNNSNNFNGFSCITAVPRQREGRVSYIAAATTDRRLCLLDLERGTVAASYEIYDSEDKTVMKSYDESYNKSNIGNTKNNPSHNKNIVSNSYHDNATKTKSKSDVMKSPSSSLSSPLTSSKSFSLFNLDAVNPTSYDILSTLNPNQNLFRGREEWSRKIPFPLSRDYISVLCASVSAEQVQHLLAVQQYSNNSTRLCSTDALRLPIYTPWECSPYGLAYAKDLELLDFHCGIKPYDQEYDQEYDQNYNNNNNNNHRHHRDRNNPASPPFSSQFLDSQHSNEILSSCPVTPNDSYSSDPLALDWIASGSTSGRISLFDFRIRKPGLTWQGHTSKISSLAAGSNHMLVSASYDRTIRIWDVRYDSRPLPTAP
eukprot:CAMPEP_0175064184 /NCGR_PEP_ID=MMETSP0052_2-20121109/15179_1 /TAXON_ID=51329 ORGANISM="Polytomella parva, Strain SAG 63-3" /NCGR_SAMPLE_ID=MMETSP0052_2 /ASSEMBLY_ACC=CAM_ASM_000194 /LENGTH=591 /DNA_ID=CAMNT_0016330481 /DNA_START=185 /DNA_END=1957 /DNA_ORIENTATION=+